MRNIKFKNIIMLTIAGLVNAFGVTVFLSTVKLYDSGIFGTAMLLSRITPDWCSLSKFCCCLIFRFLFLDTKSRGVY